MTIRCPKCGAETRTFHNSPGFFDRKKPETMGLRCSEDCGWSIIVQNAVSAKLRLEKELSAALRLCQIYFEIAETAIPEDKIGQMRDEKIAKLQGGA